MRHGLINSSFPKVSRVQLYTHQNRVRPYEHMGVLKSCRENESRELAEHIKQRNTPKGVTPLHEPHKEEDT